MSGRIVQMAPKVLDIGDAASYLAMSEGTFRTHVLPHVRQINLSARRRGYLEGSKNPLVLMPAL